MRSDGMHLLVLIRQSSGSECIRPLRLETTAVLAEPNFRTKSMRLLLSN